jgi:release factor glutamine methyltransferase
VSQQDDAPARAGAGSSAPDPQDPAWTVHRLLTWTTGHFSELGIESARLDAELLLGHALGLTRLQVYLELEKPVTPEERGRYRELVQHRGQRRVPVSQLLGEKEFWSLSIGVTSDVLTPRPDTETLVDAALDRLPDPSGAYDILDIGTGSGAIALALASERMHARLVASDISAAALKVARETADKLQLNERVCFVEGSLFDAVGGDRFDMVVSNPPYIARSQAGSLPPELAHEPDIALFGGEDGFEVLRPLISGVGSVLKPGGHFLVELDPGQAQTVAGWCTEAGLDDVKTLNDLTHRPRVVAARKPGRDETTG